MKITEELKEKMNSFYIIQKGIKNQSSDESIIDELQSCYPTSDICNNILLVDNTRRILETPEKILLSEMKSNYFLVKSGKEYIDIESGRKFKPFTDLTYSKCHHGLCKKFNTLVLKNIIKNKKTPNIFIAIDKKSKEYNSIKIKFQNDAKKEQTWEFDSYEIEELLKGIDIGLSNKQLAVKLCCPRECIPNLIKHIDINKKIERRQNGNNKNKNKSRVGKRRTNRKRPRKN